MGVQRQEKARVPRTSSETSLSERRIKTLRISPYSSKTWRENPAKVLIPKDRSWKGVPRYRPVNATTKEYTLPSETPRNFILERTDGEHRLVSKLRDELYVRTIELLQSVTTITPQQNVSRETLSPSVRPPNSSGGYAPRLTWGKRQGGAASRWQIAIIELCGGSSSIGRASDCGSDGCGFNSRLPPQRTAGPSLHSGRQILGD